MGTLVDILTTNETYFLREEYQLKAFKEEILPEMLKKKKDIKFRHSFLISSIIPATNKCAKPLISYRAKKGDAPKGASPIR